MYVYIYVCIYICIYIYIYIYIHILYWKWRDHWKCWDHSGDTISALQFWFPYDQCLANTCFRKGITAVTCDKHDCFQFYRLQKTMTNPNNATHYVKKTKWFRTEWERGCLVVDNVHQRMETERACFFVGGCTCVCEREGEPRGGRGEKKWEGVCFVSPRLKSDSKSWVCTIMS